MIKTLYLEKVDKPNFMFQKLKIEQDNCKIYANLEKEKNIKKVVSKIVKAEINAVVLSKELKANKQLINKLNSANIRIFDGRWLEKYLTYEILEFILKQKNQKKEETELAITTNEITDSCIQIIKTLAKQYKRVTVVTNHLNKLRKIEKELYDEYGVLILVSNNQKKSLAKTQLILNMDFNKEVLNKYKINDIVTCKVVKFAPFGAFLEMEKGLEGLVHNSEITGLRRVVKPEDELKIGQTVNAKIINIDKEKLKIGLSIKEIEGTSAEYGYEEYISQ